MHEAAFVLRMRIVIQQKVESYWQMNSS